MIFLFLLTSVFAHENHGPGPVGSSDNLEKDIVFYQNRLKTHGPDLVSLQRLGNLFLSRARLTGSHDDFTLAEETFARLLAIEKDNLAGLTGISYAQMGKHHFKQALVHARQAGLRAPNQPQVWALLGDLHLSLGNLLEADMFYNRLLNHKRSLASLSRTAQMAEARGDAEKASALYFEALTSEKNQTSDKHQMAWVHTMLGELHLQAGHWQASRQEFETALTLWPKEPYSQWRLAVLDLEEGHPVAAEKRMHDLIHDQPNRPQYWFTYARTKTALNKSAAADHWFQKAEKQILGEVEAGDIGHIRELVTAWLDREIHPKKALNLALKDLQEVRQDRDAYELAAWAHHLNGQPKKAAQAMDQALLPGLLSKQTLLRAGLVYYHANQKIRAAQLLRVGFEKSGPVSPSLVKQAATIRDRIKSNPRELFEPLLKNHIKASQKTK